MSLLDTYLDWFARWIWYPLCDAVETVTGVRGYRRRMAEWRRAEVLALADRLDDAQLDEIADRLRAAFGVQR